MTTAVEVETTTLVLTQRDRERLAWVVKAAKTSKVGARDFPRPHLEGVLLESKGGKWTAIATDSYRMHECTFVDPVDAPEGVTGWLTFDHATAICKVKTVNAVTVTFGEHGVMAENMISPPSASQLPDYAQLWPDESAFEFDTRITLPGFSVKGGKNAPATVRIDGDDAAFILSATTREGDIGVNPVFFCDAVGDRYETRLRAINPFKPILVERENERALLMPIRLNR